MKTYVTLLLSLLAVNAMADTKAYRSLDQGGEIVLTNEACEAAQDMQRAYWYNNEVSCRRCCRDDGRRRDSQSRDSGRGGIVGCRCGCCSGIGCTSLP